MTASELIRLRVLLSDEQIHQLATEFPGFRIPVKKLEMNRLRDEFLRLHTGSNTEALARQLGIPLSTVYHWLAKNRKCVKKSSASSSQSPHNHPPATRSDLGRVQ